MKKSLLLFCVFLASTSGTIFAQCGMYELPLSERVQHASVIFEGRVISKTCFWNAQHSLIFTSNNVEIYKLFKGSITTSIVDVITEGGMIGDEMHQIEPNLNLNEGDVGIFLAHNSGVTNPENLVMDRPVLQCYGNVQGFIKYDLNSQTANDPFKKYIDLKKDLYQVIGNLCGETLQTISSFDTEQQNVNDISTAKSGRSIVSFSPSTISAGTNSVLTIDGSGFGNTQGTSVVNFKNPDDGGASYNTASAYHYVSWSDTQIQVKVPSKSGTGTIQVVVNGTPMTSVSSLTVSYAEINAVNNSIPYQTELVELNGTGGISWQLNTTFNNNTAAKNAFKRALQTWESASQINWNIGATTSKDTIARDAVNVVRFDIGNELSAGTLARCYYYWLGCVPPGGSVATTWFVSELDMAVDGGTNWEYGPAVPTGSNYDFETVMLHELGHGHQMAHVINSSDVMHYSTQPNITKRVLNSNNISGGIDVINRSKIAVNCNGAPGPITVDISENYGTDNNALMIYPNPTSGNITIELPADGAIADIAVYDHLGGILSRINQSANSTKLTIDLSGMASGMYCIVARSNEKMFSRNIVVSR